MNCNLAEQYRLTRRESVALCEPLQNEDYGLQRASFVSPPKWHLAHTSWFFETFLLKPLVPAYRSPDPCYEVLFNSYYNGIGDQFPREQRGLLSRPTVAEVMAYRNHVDAGMLTLLEQPPADAVELIAQRCTLGIEHERQHQELFCTDLKYSLALNPMWPIYRPGPAATTTPAVPVTWQRFSGGLREIGHQGEGFAFDNESPRHQAYLQDYLLANRLVTNAEYQQFVDDGGYRRPELWLADGWSMLQEQDWRGPLYWQDQEGEASEFTLHGLLPRDPLQPVCHVSGYEADAYARWLGARLPTEAEWEYAATLAASPSAEHAGLLQPIAADSAARGLQQLYDNCWQWTQTAYGPYPGFVAEAGAIGEYNGKFMSNQWVLRGGSCVSRPAQPRASYRNFFYPGDRWQFSGIRLARNADAS